MLGHFWHILEHTLEHSISIVPFLFLTYLVMEYIEHRAGEQVQHVIEKAAAESYTGTTTTVTLGAGEYRLYLMEN